VTPHFMVSEIVSKTSDVLFLNFCVLILEQCDVTENCKKSGFVVADAAANLPKRSRNLACGFDRQPEIVSNRLIRHKTPAKRPRRWLEAAPQAGGPAAGWRPRRRLDSTWLCRFDLLQPWIEPGAFYSLGGIGFKFQPGATANSTSSQKLCQIA
jgi:hypothetical protein